MNKEILAIGLTYGGGFDKNPFSHPDRQPNTPLGKVQTPIRKLKEFKINGTRVMAYSKRDAIKRLKHINK